MARRRYSRRSRRRSNNLHQGYFIAGLLFLAVALFAVTGDGGITGFATSDDVGLNITVGNIAPTVDDISNISAQNPTEATFTEVIFTFNATDSDGGSQLTGPTGRFNLTGEAFRDNASCEEITVINSTSREYRCNIKMYYFDAPGTWTVNATISDSNGDSGTRLETFTFNQLLAMVLAPDNLTWASLAFTDTNSTANNDATQINNTGNANSNLSVTALDLHGETTVPDTLNAENFTVSTHTGGTCSGVTCSECTETLQANGSAVNITNATLPRGNFSVSDLDTGKELFYYCLLALNQSISSQSYSTSFLGPWTVTQFAV